MFNALPLLALNAFFFFSLMFSYIHCSTRGLGSLEFLGAQARARAGMTRDTQFLNLIEYSGRTKFGYVVGYVHMCALLFPTDTNGPLFYFWIKCWRFQAFFVASGVVWNFLGPHTGPWCFHYLFLCLSILAFCCCSCITLHWLLIVFCGFNICCLRFKSFSFCFQ